MRKVSLYVATREGCSGIELTLRFVLWAQQLQGAPAIEQIRSYFGCSRASAYRWRAAWCAANGIAPPRSKEHKPCTVTPMKR